MPDHEAENVLRQQHPIHETQRLLALRNGEMVGILTLSCRRDGSPGSEDYVDYVDISGGVLRDHRRQGIGRALLQGLAHFMDQRAKRIATTKVHLPEGHAYMARIGADCKLRNVENRLLFDQVDWDALDRWVEPPALRCSKLSWEIHAGRVPMARLESLMEPLTSLLNEQPLGTLDGPRLRYELASYPTWYADMDRRGGDHFMVLLRDEGNIAAACDANWDQRFPGRVHQNLTAVAQPWRGQGLAKAVKARMLKLVRERRPGVQMVTTYNANANAAMLSINRQLGFAVHREEATYQIGRAALGAYLARCG